MLSLNNIYRQIDLLYSNYDVRLTLFSLLLFVIGLFFGVILNLFIRYFPLKLKQYWFKQSIACLQLDYSDLLPLNKDLFPAKIVCRAYQNKTGYFDKAPLFYRLINKSCCFKCYRKLTCYFPVGLVTASITLLAYWRFQSFDLILAALLFSYLLIVLMFIDFHHLLLPDELTLSLLWLGLIFNLNHTFAALDDAVIGAITGYLALWGFYWLVKLATGVEGVGYGDFKLMAAMGAWLGWRALPEMLLLGCATGLCATAAIYFCRDKTVLNKPVALGGYLSLAGIMALFTQQ